VLVPAVVAVLDGLPADPFATTAYRHSSPQYHPLSGEGARTSGGRWNPPRSFSTLYLGLSLETVEAEFDRALKRANRSRIEFLPRNVYRYDVALHAVLDLRQRAAVAALDLTRDDLTSDVPRRCQTVGEAAHYLGVEAILAPSATGVGDVLAIFWDRLDPRSSIDHTRVDEWIG
jgi:RES domain-containing protein